MLKLSRRESSNGDVHGNRRQNMPAKETVTQISSSERERQDVVTASRFSSGKNKEKELVKGILSKVDVILSLLMKENLLKNTDKKFLTLKEERKTIIFPCRLDDGDQSSHLHDFIVFHPNYRLPRREESFAGIPGKIDSQWSL